MKINRCKSCQYFNKEDWSDWDRDIVSHWSLFSRIEHKIFRVCGHCEDFGNPIFNTFARSHWGRGVGKLEAFFTPRWCRFKKCAKK